jgi:hypothetical protein
LDFLLNADKFNRLKEGGYASRPRRTPGQRASDIMFEEIAKAKERDRQREAGQRPRSLGDTFGDIFDEATRRKESEEHHPMIDITPKAH